MSFDPKKLEAYPNQPGVYIMKNAAGNVLYVGKAINLRQRIRQYFIPGGDGRVMVPQLVQKVASVETIIVNSEKEALLLENNLIKKHTPPFNALLKDDKSYIALRVTHKQKWPKLELVRFKGKPDPNALYFGPYTSALSARATFDLLNRLFPLRQCSDQEFSRRTRPCILYDMKRCIAPCVGKCTKEEYDHYVEKTIKFLKGQDSEVVKDLYEEMHLASEALEFERAGSILRTIQQIERTIEGQKVDKLTGQDLDVLAVFRQGEDVILQQLMFRAGKLISSRHFDFVNIAQDDRELLQSFLIQHYESKEDLPHLILVPENLPDAAVIAEILSSGKKRKVEILSPQRGEKRAFIAMAYTNAEATFHREKDAQAIREKTLSSMQEKFHLKKFPCRIECFDNSNLGGSEPVSALVAFTDGEKDSSRYRKYKIKEALGTDDYASMREVLMRRFKRGMEEKDLPDLVIVDGGKGHLNIALKILAELDIVTIDVIGVAKEEGRHDKGMTTEQVFLPNSKDPVFLPKNSPILFLLQKIRDEAHRFAITFQRKRRSKKMIKSALDDIPGIGPTKKKLLLAHFGSVKKIREATKEELEKVKGLSQANIQAIYTGKLNEQKGGSKN